MAKKARNLFFNKMTSIFVMIIGVLTILAFHCFLSFGSAYADSNTQPNYAKSTDLTTPVIYGIDMEQAYITDRASGAFVSSGKTYGKGIRDYAAWSGYNSVEIGFRNQAASQGYSRFSIEYHLQRSTNQSSGFQDITAENAENSITWVSARGSITDSPYRALNDLGNGVYSFTDDYAKRGKKYYYRIVAQYTYYDKLQGTEVVAQKSSNTVSIRTSPKTFVATSFLVKTSKGWKKSAKIDISTKKGRQHAHKFKITWNKRNDVDGYYVYRVSMKAVAAKKIKKWQYRETMVSYGAQSYGATTAKRYCKKVKTLKAGATSYTFSLKDGGRYFEIEHPAYVIVPFVVQNGKKYTADSKKAFHPYNGSDDAVVVRKSKYLHYIPFPL